MGVLFTFFSFQTQTHTSMLLFKYCFEVVSIVAQNAPLIYNGYQKAVLLCGGLVEYSLECFAIASANFFPQRLPFQVTTSREADYTVRIGAHDGGTLGDFLVQTDDAEAIVSTVANQHVHCAWEHLSQVFATIVEYQQTNFGGD